MSLLFPNYWKAAILLRALKNNKNKENSFEYHLGNKRVNPRTIFHLTQWSILYIVLVSLSLLRSTPPTLGKLNEEFPPAFSPDGPHVKSPGRTQASREAVKCRVSALIPTGQHVSHPTTPLIGEVRGACIRWMEGPTVSQLPKCQSRAAT